jgi:hypothetical protein
MFSVPISRNLYINYSVKRDPSGGALRSDEHGPNVLYYNIVLQYHINKICSRASSILGFIRRNLRHSNKNFKEQAYISLVRSVLDYASSVWDPHLQKDIDRLEGVQRRDARFVCNDYGRRSSVTNMMRDLNWRPLIDRRRDQRLALFHKIVYDLVAIPSTELIEFNQRHQRRSNSKSIKQISCNTDIYKYSFIPQTIRDWNTLPNTVVTCEKKEAFRTALSNFRKKD